MANTGSAVDHRKEVIIFLDVDGVLNDKWIGHNDSSPREEESLHPEFIDNLRELVGRLETERGFEPAIVLSTTWRLQQRSRDELLSSFAKKKVGNSRTLKDYLKNYGDHGHISMSSWITPYFAHGTGPEGRAAEIQAWLSNHCRTNGVNRSDLLFLILDDLDLLYTETGKRNEFVCQTNFVCTVSYKGCQQVEGAVGLTRERVELALQKVKQQLELRTRRRFGTGKWTEAEWDLISANPIMWPHLSALRSDNCPSWIGEKAQNYVKQQTRKHSRGTTKRFWRWRWRRE